MVGKGINLCSYSDAMRECEMRLPERMKADEDGLCRGGSSKTFERVEKRYKDTDTSERIGHRQRRKKRKRRRCREGGEEVKGGEWTSLV